MNRNKSQSLSLTKKESVNDALDVKDIRWSYLAFQGSQHHMRRIQAVHEIGWECRSLLSESTAAGESGSEIWTVWRVATCFLLVFLSGVGAFLALPFLAGKYGSDSSGRDGL